MSFKSSFVLVFFLFLLPFLTMHACKARPLQQMYTVSGSRIELDMGIAQGGKKVPQAHHHPKKSHDQIEEAIVVSSSSSGAPPANIKEQQLVSVSWHFNVRPPDNIHQTIKGLFSDYSKPKMRPPSHN